MRSSTNYIIYNGNFVEKTHKTKATCIKEFNILKFLEKHGVSNIVRATCILSPCKLQMNRICPSKNLEDMFKACIFPVNTRHKLWNTIIVTLSHLQMLNVTHGDFKAKNILIDETNTPILCDFDLGILGKLSTDDNHKASILYFQMFCVRDNDTHHWPYHNNDKEYRNGEQIYLLNGKELMKDIENLNLSYSSITES